MTKQEKTNILIVIIVLLFSLIAQLIIIHSPCLEYKIEDRFWKTNECKSGIMFPGFCIIEEKIHYEQDIYCIKRKFILVG